MTDADFGILVAERCEQIKAVLAAKASEYARGDRLHNFKRAASFMRCTPERACLAFAMKHLTSIADLVDDLDAQNPPTKATIDEKLGDAVNYLILLEALMKERNGAFPS